jgi:diguanylate cyclase (GGDEF)-like protein
VIWDVYLSAAIWSLWSAREEKLHARWPLMALLALHAIIFFGAGAEILSGTFQLNEAPSLNTFFGAFHFESILYSMGTAIFMVLMCKERIELRYINAARIDALTRTVNHGAWFESARRLLNRCQQERSPLSLIMFDLDRFKTVNDIHGHLVGDRVLQAFADTVRGALRPNDLFGRYGGEEFTVVLPGATIETAHVIADRVRRAFADAHRFLDGQPLHATVSAGVASASSSATLEAIIEAADNSMYAAKNAGRNCVKPAGDDRPADGDKVIRVA